MELTFSSILFHTILLLVLAALSILLYRSRRRGMRQLEELKSKESQISIRAREMELLNTKLSRAYQSLASSEKNFRGILRKLPIPFVLYNHQNLSMKYVNDKFADAYGYTTIDFNSYEQFWQALCPDPEYRSQVIRRWCEIFNDLIMYGSSVQSTEIAVTCKDGNIKRVELDMVKLGSYFIATFSDMTERISNEESLRQAKEKAEQADKMKSAFLANVSHEIRNPMNGIMGFVQLLTRTTDPDKLKFYTSIILQNSHHLIGILNDVLEISKIESGTIAIEKKPFVLNQMLGGLQRFFESEVKLRKKNILIRTHFSRGEEFIINTDDTRLYQVLNNLLNNALKFTEEGEISFGYEVTGANIRFYVRDTGIGIEKDKQQLIFERFYQLEEHSRKVYGGTGLGLSIARGIVEKIGGRLTVESEPGKGSEFSFILPLDPDAGDVILQEMKLHDHDLKGKKILVVEDEYDNFQMIREALIPLKAEVIHACDGRMAVELCKDDPKIDLVLMDIKMKGMSGTEATNNIKSFRKDLPIIAHTADGFEGNRKRCKEAGCSDFVLKPVDVGELIRKISGELKK